MEDKSKENLITKIMDCFGEPNENEFAKDIEKAKKLEKKTKSLNFILLKYEKERINKEVCKAMLSDIISSLLKDRKDFPILMDIYMNTIDDLVEDCLSKHFILKNSKPKKIEKCDTSNGYIKFGIDLSCLNSDDNFYHKFIKGMLKYFQLSFENEYLYGHLQKKYFQNMDKSKEYTDNISSIVYSLNKMMNDIRRVLSGESNHKISCQEKDTNKMNNIKNKVFCIRARAHEMKDIFGIYDKCKNNTEIINEIKKLYKNTNKLELLALQDIV